MNKAVKITKVDGITDKPHPIGKELKGMMLREVVVGNRVQVIHTNGTRMLITSEVTEILSENKFKTENSTYYWEFI